MSSDLPRPAETYQECGHKQVTFQFSMKRFWLQEKVALHSRPDNFNNMQKYVDLMKNSSSVSTIANVL